MLSGLGGRAWMCGSSLWHWAFLTTRDPSPYTSRPAASPPHCRPLPLTFSFQPHQPPCCSSYVSATPPPLPLCTCPSACEVLTLNIRVARALIGFRSHILSGRSLIPPPNIKLLLPQSSLPSFLFSMYFDYLFIIYPPLECQLHQGRDFCLFCSLFPLAASAT